MKKVALMLVVGAFLAFAASAQAQTNSQVILYPYFVSNPGTVATIVTLVNTVNNTCNAHLRYYFKVYDNGEWEETCSEYDDNLTLTKWDMVSWDVSGHFGTGALFGDTNSPGTGQFDLEHLSGYSTGRGYLVVEADCVIDGEYTILEVVNGAAVGDRALLGRKSATSCAQTGVFSGLTKEALDEGQQEVVTVLPSTDFTTKFIVTPLDDPSGTGATMCPNVNDYTATIRFVKPGTANEYGFCDRKEVCPSIGEDQTVTCVDVVTLEDLLGGVIPAWAQNGGWSLLRLSAVNNYDGDNVAGDDVNGDQATVFKIEYGTGFGGSMTNSWVNINNHRL
ncbi:hypothetical protein [Thermodesulforhabdus norvegica]|uniref:Uncharacterized protein n=1 Tax=Thermodesulforhabdus norvegica TaxID=39841 RepID=A0A1I4V0A2_9BACT|nr:hypothetical protein [Thermodesulforhabdus norvegica]SFM94565.1 hypothetical protein SAMN05660836_02069 [Thermodesulforhabdus norvegica]